MKRIIGAFVQLTGTKKKSKKGPGGARDARTTNEKESKQNDRCADRQKKSKNKGRRDCGTSK